MAPKVEGKSWTETKQQMCDSDFKFGKDQCACKKLENVPKKRESGRPKYRSVSASDVSYKKKLIKSDDNLDEIKLSKGKKSRGSVSDVDLLSKDDKCAHKTKGGYSRLVYLWKRLQKSLSSKFPV